MVAGGVALVPSSWSLVDESLRQRDDAITSTPARRVAPARPACRCSCPCQRRRPTVGRPPSPFRAAHQRSRQQRRCSSLRALPRRARSLAAHPRKLRAPPVATRPALERQRVDARAERPIPSGSCTARPSCPRPEASTNDGVPPWRRRQRCLPICSRPRRRHPRPPMLPRPRESPSPRRRPQRRARPSRRPSSRPRSPLQHPCSKVSLTPDGQFTASQLCTGSADGLAFRPTRVSVSAPSPERTRTRGTTVRARLARRRSALERQRSQAAARVSSAGLAVRARVLGP